LNERIRERERKRERKKIAKAKRKNGKLIFVGLSKSKSNKI
jgi:hypothetical protein